MTDVAVVEAFIAKWRARWPEWNIARVFVPAAWRELADAWFALLQELTDAAWSGGDPTPGLAKLAWWQEELRGWSKRARRHPLGERLQPFPAPWDSLAISLMALQRGRACADDLQAALATVRPFAAAVAQCEAILFGPSGEATASIAIALLGQRLLSDPEAAVPSRIPEHADASEPSARAWATQLSADGWLVATRPRRIHAALLRARLAQFARTGEDMPLMPWRTLLVAWRAARKA